MKTIVLTLSALLFIGNLAFSTSCQYDKDYGTLFKKYKDLNIDFVAGKGIVLEKKQEYVNIKLLEIFYIGTPLPSDSIITIRNGMKKFDVFDGGPGVPARVLYAKDYLSDTVVFLVPKVIEKFYSWDVIGEYRIRPDTLDDNVGYACIGQFELSVKKDTVYRKAVEYGGYFVLKYTDEQFKRYIGIITGLASSELQKEEFSLFPNPSENLLNITLNKPCAGCKVEILDSYSKSVFEIPYDDASLDISNLKSGLYYFLLKDNNRTVGSSKFVKK